MPGRRRLRFDSGMEGTRFVIFGFGRRDISIPEGCLLQSRAPEKAAAILLPDFAMRIIRGVVVSWGRNGARPQQCGGKNLGRQSGKSS